MAANSRLSAEVRMVGFCESTEIAPDHPVVVALQKVAGQVLDRRVDPGVFPGATDALSFQGIAGIPTVAAFGPGYVPRAHAPNERLSVEGVNQAAKICALAALRYLVSSTTTQPSID